MFCTRYADVEVLVDFGQGGFGATYIGDALARRIHQAVAEMYHIQPVTISEFREWSDWEELGHRVDAEALATCKARGGQLTASRGLIERGHYIEVSECAACAAEAASVEPWTTAPVVEMEVAAPAPASRAVMQ